jgi:hypothetical protein
MQIANGTHKTAARICDALGLKDVRALSLSMAVDDAVMLAATQYVTGDQINRFAGELETRQYVLVPHEWTPVGERTPDATDTVWVSCSEGVVMSDYLGPGQYGGFWTLGTMADREGLNSERLQGVTHWMPIYQPAPPQVE